MSRPLGRIHRPAAAYGKNHVRFCDFRNLRQSLRILEGGVIAVKERPGDSNNSLTGLPDQRLRCRPGLIAAHNHRRLPVLPADGGNGIIGIGANGEMGEKCTFHKKLLFVLSDYGWMVTLYSSFGEMSEGSEGKVDGAFGRGHALRA